MAKHVLGTYRRVDWGHEYRDVEEITPDEYERYHDAAVAFRRLMIRLPIQIVERNYGELVSLAAYYGKLFSISRGERAVVRPEHAAMALARAVINWLTSFRLFLDHTSTDINRRFGEDSDELNAYEGATHEAYDRSAAYRLISRFRNYVQHCGMPFSSVRGGILDEETRSTYIEFVMDRNELLEGFDWNQREREDLGNQPEEMDVIALIDETMRELRTISRTVLNIDVDHAIQNVEILEEALERIAPGDDEAPMLITREESSPDDLSMSNMTLPMHTDLHLLGDAARSEDPLAVLLQRDDRTELAAHSTAQSGQLDRGVAVMATWFQQGGADALFGRFVSGLVRQDGSIEPVIKDLTGLTAISLHMAAAAAGTSAEDLLGRLIAQPPSQGEVNPD
jgi:hypothetical protein